MDKKSDDRTYWKSEEIYAAIFEMRNSMTYGEDNNAYRSNLPKNTKMRINQLKDTLKSSKTNLKSWVNKAYSFVRIKDNQIVVQTAILYALASGPKNAADIQRYVDSIYQDESVEGVSLPRKSLDNALKKLVQAGMLVVSGKQYSLSRDIFKAVRNDSGQILDFLKFVENASAFSGLVHSTLRVEKITGNSSCSDMEVGRQYEHMSAGQILDEYCLWIMMSAYSEQKAVHLTYYHGDTPDELVCVPLKAVYDNLHNRVYFVVYETAQKQVSVLRADRMLKPDLSDEDITELLQSEEYRMKVENALEILKNAWITSLLNQQKKVVLQFDKKAEARVRNECHNAEIEKNDNGFRLTVTVNDPLEMISWIRTFGPKCEILEPQELRDRECRNLQKWVDFYGEEL